MEDTPEILDVLRKNRIVIYGAGYMARMFYRALNIWELDKNVDFFVVSSKKENSEDINGINVIAIDELRKNSGAIICIAVHEILKEEIEQGLRQRGEKNYIWISPHIYSELFFGIPQKRNLNININEIIQKNSYSIAVRYLAIENYFGKNDYGYKIYKKVQEKFFGYEAAQRRLLSFCNLIRTWDSKECLLNNNILLDKNYEIIDGAHRIALAKYYQANEVTCDIYNGLLKHSDLKEGKIFLEKDSVSLFGFTTEELKIIEAACERIQKMTGRNS